MKLRLGILAIALAAAIAIVSVLSVGHGSTSHVQSPAARSAHVMAPSHVGQQSHATVAAPKPAKAHPATQPAASTPAPTVNPIPQGNGGDHDSDNSGDPSDGDGSL